MNLCYSGARERSVEHIRQPGVVAPTSCWLAHTRLSSHYTHLWPLTNLAISQGYQYIGETTKGKCYYIYNKSYKNTHTHTCILILHYPFYLLILLNWLWVSVINYMSTTFIHSQLLNDQNDQKQCIEQWTDQFNKRHEVILIWWEKIYL